MRKSVVIALFAVITAVFAMPVAHADERATTIDAPDGNRYYIFAFGRAFPLGHGLEVWQETNGIAGSCNGVNEAPPLDHATEPTGVSDLQTEDGVCKGKSYKADTRLYCLEPTALPTCAALPG